MRMKWNTSKIGFLHRPDDFLGQFTNDLMQLRHEKQVQEKLTKLKDALDAEENPTTAMLLLNKLDHIQFLENNIDTFRAHGEFESALLRLYRRKNGPFSTPNNLDTWKRFFSQVDPVMMRQQGEEIVFQSATLYRGSVIGTSRSLSWSPDRERAVAFARRCEDPNLGGGETFSVEVSNSDLLVYLTDKGDEEIIVSPEFIEHADIKPFGAAH